MEKSEVEKILRVGTKCRVLTEELDHQSFFYEGIVIQIGQSSLILRDKKGHDVAILYRLLSKVVTENGDNNV